MTDVEIIKNVIGGVLLGVVIVSVIIFITILFGAFFKKDD